MNKKLIILFSLAFLLSLPAVSLAVNLMGLPGTTNDIFKVIGNIFGLIWPIFAGFAVIMFVVAGFLFLTAQGDAAKLKDARNAVVFGAVGVGVGLLAFSIPLIIQKLLTA